MGPNLRAKNSKAFAPSIKSKKSFSAVAHPQANRQVEEVNKIIKTTIKKRLDKAKDGWVDELPLSLWEYRPTHKTAIGHTPFTLSYGFEAMIPVELEVLTHQRLHFDSKENEKLELEALEQLEERRKEAELRVADTSIRKSSIELLKLET